MPTIWLPTDSPRLHHIMSTGKKYWSDESRIGRVYETDPLWPVWWVASTDTCHCIGKPVQCIEAEKMQVLTVMFSDWGNGRWSPSNHHSIWGLVFFFFECLERFINWTCWLMMFSRLSADLLHNMTKVLQFVFVNPRCKRWLISNNWSYIFIGDMIISCDP